LTTISIARTPRPYSAGRVGGKWLEIGRVSLAKALELTALIARHDPRRRRIAALSSSRRC
jgi:hypothetical protein